jgi:hypothetical protein
MISAPCGLLRDPHKCGTELSGVTEAVQRGLWTVSLIIICSTASVDSLRLWEHGQVRRVDTKRTCSCCACDGPHPQVGRIHFQRLASKNVFFLLWPRTNRYKFTKIHANRQIFGPCMGIFAGLCHGVLDESINQ